MKLKNKVMEISDDLAVACKEFIFRTVNPHIELSKCEDGKIKAKLNGPLSNRMQGLADYYCAQLNRMKVIKRLPHANIYSLYHPPFPSKAGDKAVMARIRDAVFKLRTPTTNTMAVTYKCQCNCVHCSAHIKINPNVPELTADEWKKVIDDSCQIGIYNHVITGGEPLLRPDLAEIISHVTPEMGTTLMFSNGILLAKRAKELADAGLYAVNISIDDLDPAVHNNLRRTKFAYEMAFEGAAAAREYGILTGISTYATSEKIKNGELEKLIDEAKELGFHEVTIFDPVPSGRWIHDISCLLNEDERAYLRELTLSNRQKPDGPGVIAQSYINSPYGSGCFGGYYQLYTTAYGDVNPCDFNPVSFGNIRREGGILHAWNKMIHHPEYRCRRGHCRMQNAEYRKTYIEPIPDNVIWPIPIEFYENGHKEEFLDRKQKPISHKKATQT